MKNVGNVDKHIVCYCRWKTSWQSKCCSVYWVALLLPSWLWLDHCGNMMMMVILFK